MITEQDMKRIIDAAIETRKLQKAYFRTRDRLMLERSKAAEATLDRLLEDYTTPKLFDI